MSRAWRVVLVLTVWIAAWPEIPRYRAERDLALASQRIDQVMRGGVRGAEAVDAAAQAEALANGAAAALPGDPRVPLHRGVALMLLGRSREAVAVFEEAVRFGERPELTLNLGRARFQDGDVEGADRAYLRAAWAAPSVLATLPKPMRAALLDEVARLEHALHEGRLPGPPPLD